MINLAGPILSMQSSIRGSGNESETVTAMILVANDKTNRCLTSDLEVLKIQHLAQQHLGADLKHLSCMLNHPGK